MKKLFLVALLIAAILCTGGCEPPEKQETETTAITASAVSTEATTVQSEEAVAEITSETTTGRVGGFIVKENAPGADIEWEDIGASE